MSVDCANRSSNLADVELGRRLVERVDLDQERHEVAAWQELHHHVQVRSVLERIEQHHDRRIRRDRKHVAFRSDVSNLVLCHHDPLQHGLESAHF
ncbi:MAG: hypothetical protein AAF108_06435, partial [Planctomycetota bacterium]